MEPRHTLNTLKERLAERLPPSLKFRLKCAVADARHRLGRLWAREHGAGDVRLAASAADGGGKPFVLVVDDSLPRPDRDAGSARMVFILRALSEWSRPVFVYLSKNEWPEYESQLRQAGVETARAVHLRRLTRERSFYAAVLSRPATAEAVIGEVRRADPRMKVVYDMLDVHHLRAEREAALTGDARAAREAEHLRQLETRLARAADLVWCGSPPDQQIMARAAPGAPSVVIPTIHELHGRGRPFAGREHLLFVGNFSHRPNVDAVHFLAREVMPLVRRDLARVELLVVGDNAPPEFAGYASGGVRLLGYVPDLNPVMSGCRVFVAPIRFGSGVNGKIGEALSYGLPVVTTNVGAEGWGFTGGEQVLMADAPADFAEAVLRLYGDAALWQRLSDGGYRHIAENNTPEVLARVINDSLRGVAAPHAETARLPATDS
jgi:O-antigen biosynthesis protein